MGVGEEGFSCGYGELCGGLDRFYVNHSCEESDEDEQEYFACSIALVSRAQAVQEEEEEE